MPRGRGAAEQRREVEAWRASGLTADAFCARRGFSAKSLFRWAAGARTLTVTRPAEFVRLEVSRAATTPSVVVEIGAARIRVGRGFDADLLHDVIAALAPRST